MVAAVLAFAALAGCGEGKGGDETGEGSRYTVSADFPSDVKFPTGTEVRIGNVRVGEVVEVRRAGPVRSAVLEIDPEHAPIDEDARAILRHKTLLGEYYIELIKG